MEDIFRLLDHECARRWAERLTLEFGSIAVVMQATLERVANVAGDPLPAVALRHVRVALTEVLRRQAHARPIINRSEALLDYLHGEMAHRTTESARVLHLNTRHALLRDELLSEGSIDQAEIHVREVARRALELGSAAVILVHNHPSGDPTPSRQDIALTRAMVAALKPLNIRVHDHLIIATSGHASLRALGVM